MVVNAIPNSLFKDQGIAAGTAAAQAMIDARKNDGRFGPSQFVPNPNPGFFDPVAPNGTTVLDPTPWVGGVVVPDAELVAIPVPQVHLRSTAPPMRRRSTRSRDLAATAW